MRSLSPLALAFLLAALAALGPFSIDTYLPSFPEIGAQLGASQIEVQQTLTAYLAAFSLMALWHGALSDALGRRRVILWSLALFALASFGCALATRIEHLWLLRALQGVTAGAGMVVGRAIVRDLHEGPAAQRLMAHVGMTFALAPAIAPVIGGWLHSWFGWRSVFFFLTLFAALLWLLAWRRLPETLAPENRQSLQIPYLLRTYWQVLTRPAFLATTVALACNFTGFFIYVLSAPVFLLQHLGLSERDFGWFFIPTTTGLLVGSWLSGRLAGKLTPQATVARAYLLMAAAAVSNLLLTALLPAQLLTTVLPVFAYTTGMALAMPSLTLIALDLFPAQRGLAASCQSFLQSAANAIAAALLAPLLWSSPLKLALGMLTLLACGAIASALARRAT